MTYQKDTRYNPETEIATERLTTYEQRTAMAERVGQKLGGQWSWAGDHTPYDIVVNGKNIPVDVIRQKIHTRLIGEEMIIDVTHVTLDSKYNKEATFYKKGQHFQEDNIRKIADEVWKHFHQNPANYSTTETNPFNAIFKKFKRPY